MDQQIESHPAVPGMVFHRRFGRIAFSLSLLVCMAGQVVTAAPQHADVKAGSATVTVQGDLTRIQQQTDRAVINWRGFSIDANESVRFRQPSVSSATLNRVTGPQVSAILGKLEANGRVFLINPNGILFGKNARVDVGALIASTTNIANQNFMRGKLVFDQPSDRLGNVAQIINQGRITAAEGGLVALVAPRVSNSGVISAKLGKVVLAAGDTFTVDLYGDELISFAVDESRLNAFVNTEGKRVEHTGAIDVDGGQAVLMTARSGSAVLDNIINLDGVVRADTVQQSNGSIVLLGKGGTINVTGELSARGMSSEQHGGSIELSGDRISLTGKAVADTSGQAGGGTVQIGTDGQGADGHRAKQTRVDKDVNLTANALSEGDGGRVVVWSDGHTDFQGSIAARGGKTSGDGGFVEVSGKQTLNYAGQVDAGADKGRGGTLLLDPAYLTIGPEEAGLLNYVMRSGTTTSLQADVDITVNSFIDGRGLFEGGGITMTAGNDINLNNYVVTNNGPVSLTATGGAVRLAPGFGVFAGSGGISVSQNDTLTDVPFFTSGNLGLASTAGSVNIADGIGNDIGNLTLRAFDDINITSPIVNLSTGSTFSGTAGDDINVNAQINGSGDATAGTVTLNASGDINLNDHIVTNNGAISLTAGGTVTHLADGSAPDGLPKTKQIRSGNAAISISTTDDYRAGSLLTSGNLGVRTAGDMGFAAPIYDTAGATSLTAGGSITVDQPLSNTTTGNDLAITAGGAITVNKEIGPWDGTTGMLRDGAVAGGEITLQSGSHINVNEDIVAFNGPVSLYAGVTSAKTADCAAPPCTVNLAADTQIRSGSGALSVTAHSNLTNGIPPAAINDPVRTGFLTTGALNIESTTGDVTIQQTLPDTTGGITIRAGDAVLVNQRIYSNDADINIFAGAGGFTQNQTADPDPRGTGTVSNIDAGNGDLRIEAQGDINPSIVRSAGKLTLISATGKISGGRIAAGSNNSSNDGLPKLVELAGYSGISEFNTSRVQIIEAIAANGSVNNLLVSEPSNLRIIAKESIVNKQLGQAFMFVGNASLYAGQDIISHSIISQGLLAKAGRNIRIIDDFRREIIKSPNMNLSAGTDPFTGLESVRIEGSTVDDVSVPSWSAPVSGGDVAIGTDTVNNTVWLIVRGSDTANAHLRIDATNDIVLPGVHLSWSLSDAEDTLNARQLETSFTLNAGNAVTLQQLQTTGTVAITTTNDDINLGSTIGAHVTVETPRSGVWNPNDLGVASLSLASINANINMYEARAEGDISISAPNGQVNFVDSGGLKGIEARGAVTVTDSDGNVTHDTVISTATAARIPTFRNPAPEAAPGPTLAGPVGPAVPGAIPPGSPGAVSVSEPSTPTSSGTFLAEIDVNESVVNGVTLTENTPEEDRNTDSTRTVGQINSNCVNQLQTESTGTAGEVESDCVNRLPATAAGRDIQVNPLFFDTPDGEYIAFGGGQGVADDEDLGRFYYLAPQNSERLSP